MNFFTILFIIWGCMFIVFLSVALHIREKYARKAKREQAEEDDRQEAVDILSAAYKDARSRGIKSGKHIAALSHCCLLLNAGHSIDRGAAILALKGCGCDEAIEQLNAISKKSLAFVK